MLEGEQLARILSIIAAFLLICVIYPYSIDSSGNVRQAMNVDASLNEILFPHELDIIVGELPIELSVVAYNNCSYEYPANVTFIITTSQIPAYQWIKTIEIMFASDYQTIIVNETWTPPEVPLGLTQVTITLEARISVPSGMTDIQSANDMRIVNFVLKKSYMTSGKQALAWLIPQVSSRVSTYGIEEDIVSPTLISIGSALSSGIPIPDATTILEGVKNSQLNDGAWSVSTPVSSTASIGLGVANIVDSDSTFVSILIGAANALVNRTYIYGDWAYWIPENWDQPVNGSTIITSCSAIYVISKANKLSPNPSYVDKLSMASSWLSNISSAKTRECAFIALASVSLGIMPDAQTVIENATKVMAAQNSDGGWKETTTLQSSPYATGQIMYALMSAKHDLIPSSLDDSANYLIDTQTASGYWALTSSNSQYSQVGKMNIAGTAWACAALRNYTHSHTTMTYNENTSLDIVMEPREEGVFDILINNTGLGWSIYTHTYSELYEISFDYPVGWTVQLLGEVEDNIVALPGNSQKTISIGVIAPWDGVDGEIDYIKINATSLLDGSISTFTINATLDINIGVDANVPSFNFNASKGMNVTIPLTVMNTGNVNDTIQLSLAGLPVDWTTTLPSSITLNGGSYRFVPFNIFVPANASSGVKYITLWAISSRISSYFDSLVLEINVINILPQLTTTPLYDPSISEGESITFTASALDPEGKPITYEWFVDGVSVSLGNSQTEYVYYADYSSAGIHNITVRAYDDFGYTERAWIVVILDVPAKPEFTYLNPSETNLSILENEELTFQIEVNDPDGNIVSVQWYVNAELKGSGNEYTFNSSGLSLGTYDISVVATDNIGLTNSYAWKVLVYRPNAAPIIDFSSPSYLTCYIDEGENIEFSCNASDADSQSIWYHWFLDTQEVPSEPLKPNVYIFRANHSSSGTHEIKVGVTDGFLWTNMTWTVIVNETNAPPKIVLAEPVGDITLYVGDNATFIIVSSDEDNDNLQILWYVNNLEVENGSSSYKLEIPRQNTYAGNYFVQVQVTDGKESITRNWQVTVKPILNIAPSADPGESRSVEINKIVYFDGSGSKDEDGKIVNYTWTFDDGTVSYGVETEHIFKTKGPHIVALTVYDDLGENNTAKITIKVYEKQSEEISNNMLTLAIAGAVGGAILIGLGFYLFVYRPSQKLKEVKKKKEENK